MSFDSILVAVLAIIFFASLARAVFGFADALIAMPLLAAFGVGLDVSRPLVALMAISVAFVMLARDWRNIRFSTAWKLILPAFVGIPFGFLLADKVPESIANLLLGVLVISFAIYNLLRPRLSHLTHDRWAWAFGFLAGVIGAAYNTPGPLVVIYGTLRGWKPDEFRATVQGYLLPTAIVIVVGHAINQRLTPTVMWYYVHAIPVMAAAVIVGRLLARLVREQQFRRLLYILLLAIGAMLVYRSVTEMLREPKEESAQVMRVN